MSWYKFPRRAGVSVCTVVCPLVRMALLLFLAACQDRAASTAPAADPVLNSSQVGQQNAHGFTAPTAFTVAANREVLEQLPFSNQQDFKDANRGLLARADSLVVTRDDGTAVWNQDRYRFIQGDAPGSVNPSLWRQAKLNGLHGLFEVTPGIYQLRGFDLGNLTVIEGETGLIVVDPLTTRETAAAAWQFYRQHRGDKPIVAIIFTHSHVDHFGGIFGVLSAVEAKARGVRIIVPAGFMHEAVSENIMVGTAMQRRASLMYGQQLPRNARGHVDTGLGKEPPLDGTIGILQPTDIIDRTGQRLTLDGVEFVFQNAPDSEAPAELTFYLPGFKAWCGAELVSRNFHNVYTLRGAKVRNALLWSQYIEEARRMFGDADIYFASHHWPIWGRDAIQSFLKQQRDVYKFVHDQTVRLINQGYTPREISERLKLPQSLQKNFATRGYYGTLKHNSKAVYQWYMGWYDANAANLDPLPPEQAAVGYVKLAGGSNALLAQAQHAYDNGEYRWAAQLLSHLIFAEPRHQRGRELLAASYDQLGYQAESGPWRDVYLSSAYELRHGRPEKTVNVASAIDMLRQVPVSQFLDAMAASIIPEKVAGKTTAFKFNFTDKQEAYTLYLANSVLHHRPWQDDDRVDATLNITHAMFLQMMTGQAGIKETLFSDQIDIDGSRIKLLGFFASLDKADGLYNIAEP